MKSVILRSVIQCDDQFFEAAHWCLFAAWSSRYDKYNPSEEAVRMINALLGLPVYLVW